MASPDDAAKAERQARMSRALGAAFLAHQVNELERNVDGLSFKRGPGTRGGRGANDRGHHRGGSARGGRGGSTAHSGPPSVPNSRPTVTESPSRPLPKRVVDASALLYALPVIKQWIRTAAYQIVVPQEAIVTLDLLKKGTTPLALAARDGTRFLDTQLERTTTSLVFEHDGEALSAEALDEVLAPHLTQLAEEQRALLPDALFDDEEDAAPERNIPSASSVVPRHLQTLLRYALHLSERAYHPSEQPVVTYVVHPDDEDERASGAGVADWTIACGLASYAITADEVAAAREASKAFHRAQKEESEPHRGGGRGRGRGGRGRGRGSVRAVEGTEPSHRKLFEP